MVSIYIYIWFCKAVIAGEWVVRLGSHNFSKCSQWRATLRASASVSPTSGLRVAELAPPTEEGAKVKPLAP